MKVRVAALGDPDNLVHVQWPHEWRIPVAGDHLVLPDVCKQELEVAHVVWIVTKLGTTDVWAVTLFVYGPAFDASQR